MTIHCRVTAFLSGDTSRDLVTMTFDLEQLSYMAGHVTNPATKFEDPMTILSWVTSYNVSHWLQLKCVRRPFCFMQIIRWKLKIRLGNRAHCIQHAWIMLKSLVPHFYPKMHLTCTILRNASSLTGGLWAFALLTLKTLKMAPRSLLALSTRFEQLCGNSDFGVS